MRLPSAARRIRQGWRSSIAHLSLRQADQLGTDVRVHGQVIVNKYRGSSIKIGSRVTLNGSARRNTLEARGPNILNLIEPTASITIGDDTGATSATISCAQSVEIGARVLIGDGVLITDNDHHYVDHPLGPTHRRRAGHPPPRSDDSVIIHDDVFIGARSIILKGVTIGRGAVIGAGSVVTKDVAPASIVAGNPARVVRSTTTDWS